MGVDGGTDIPIGIFGSYYPNMPPEDLPHGVSPDCADIIFPPGSVKTRPGLSNYFTNPIPPPESPGSSPPVFYMKTYTDPEGNDRLLYFDGTTFWQDFPPQTETILRTGFNSGIAAGLLPHAKTVSAFGREYIAISDGIRGSRFPAQFDGVNYDRVTQDGPGAGPTVTDFLPAAATLGAPGGGTSASIATAVGAVPQTQVYPGGPGGKPILITVDTVAKITTTAAHGFVNGSTVNISGNSFVPNGSYPVSGVTALTFNISYQSYPVGQSGTGGTASEGPPSSLTWQRVNNVVTGFTTTPNGFQVGWTVVISGLPDAVLANIASISRVANIVTVNTATPHSLVVDSNITIAGVTGDTTFNGTPIQVETVPNPTQFTFTQNLPDSNTATPATGTVASILNNVGALITATPTPNSFQYLDIGPNETSTTAGAATIQGNVGPGLHQVAVSFITRSGGITAPSPPTYFNAGGGKLVSVTNIPTGPVNVIGRILMFTTTILEAGASGPFFSIEPTMIVMDNTTTSAVFDFSDSTLAAGQPMDGQFRLHTLRECLGVANYSSRMFWWGELTNVGDFGGSFNNLMFDGGWNLGGGTGGSDVPLGWTSDPTFGGGGSRESSQVVWGDAYRMTGDGVSVNVGEISQPAFRDANNNDILQVNTDYSVRLNLITDNTPTNGTFFIEIFSNSFGFLGSNVIPGSSLTNGYNEFTVHLMNPQASIPSDAVLQLGLTGTPNAGSFVIVDEINVFPTLQPVNTNFMRVSLADAPESFDSETGILQPADQMEQWVRNAYIVRERFHVVKQHSIYVTQDSGNSEPASWAISRISPKVGTPSIHGIDVAEEWAVIAEESGLYIYYGGQPVKITQEIQSDPTELNRVCWDAINWQQGQNVWVKIDTAHRRILVGAPVGSASSPNRIFVLDYQKLDTADEIANSPPIHMSYTGRAIARDVARKWTIWNMAANYGALIPFQNAVTLESVDVFMFGNEASDGQIYQLLDANLSDLGRPINGYYQTYFTPSLDEEQALQLGSHRKLENYLTSFVEGAGQLLTTVYAVGNSRSFLLSQRTLSNPSPYDFEFQMNASSERFSHRLETNAVGAWMSLQKLVPVMKVHPASPVRGTR